MGSVIDTHVPGDTLVIVPCGSAKIWDRHPDAGPTAARDAYTGYPFRVNRDYAEQFGACWRILSAKHGLISPDFIIPGSYDVSFNRRRSGPIAPEVLQRQVWEHGLDHWPVVVVLGGRHYREAVARAFDSGPSRLAFPFAGLPLGKMIQATNQAVKRGQPYPLA